MLDQQQMQMQTMFLKEAGRPVTWWWMSFVDPDTDRFLGGCAVQARGPASAILESRKQFCNPGGELVAYPFPDFVEVGQQWANRLMTEEEVHQFNDWLESEYADAG